MSGATLGSPAHGGRVCLERLEASAEGARYALELRDAEGTWTGEVAVAAADGAVAFEGLTPAEPPPPAWLLDGARAFLRTAWREVSAAPGARWPRRIQRWRAAR